MKKNYMTPSVLIVHLNSKQHLLSFSEVTSNGYVNDIVYGGLSDGSLTPEVKQYNVWDDDWSGSE